MYISLNADVFNKLFIVIYVEILFDGFANANNNQMM